MAILENRGGCLASCRRQVLVVPSCCLHDDLGRPVLNASTPEHTLAVYSSTQVSDSAAVKLPVMRKKFMRREKSVVMVPDYRTGNPYQTLLGLSLRVHGWSVAYDNYPCGYLALSRAVLKHRTASVIHIHWIPDLIASVASSRNIWIFRIKLLLLRLDIRLARLSGCTVVWTVHNRLSHQGFDEEREVRIRGALFKAVDAVLTHGDKATETITRLYGVAPDARCSVVPHGNYEGCYPAPSASVACLRDVSSLDAHAVVIFSFGMIRPYKGFERIISAVRKSTIASHRLLIEGEVQDKAYAESLCALTADDPRVRVKFGFLSDQDLADRLAVADVVACPFSATLTSGSVLLAMTMGKALLLPRAAETLDCLDPNGVIFFADDQELLAAVDSLDRKELAAMGDVNQRRAAQFSWSAVGNLTETAYLGAAGL